MGLQPSEFWDMTPWQFTIACEAWNDRHDNEHNQKAWIMWHGAALTRTKKMLPLADFYTGARAKPAAKGIDQDAIKARMKAYNTRLKKEKGNVGRK